MSNVIDLTAYRRARNIQLSEAPTDQLGDASWEFFDPEAVYLQAIREGVTYRFSDPRIVNMVAAALLTRKGSKQAQAPDGVRVIIERKRIDGIDHWQFSCERQYPTFGVCDLPQEVFEQGLEMMQTDKIYHLTVSGNGYWRVDDQYRNQKV